ncbi:ABC transporter related protein [Bacillus methanolicus PB1]|uniref:ABC transporter related protein n=1 Tax=Bacillus methanolicus PB1 TaxID=997296 RepID=I3E6Y1_BACMT|nr:ATP-binding cassette domain-containing protein [Bacillus methanolicus]EIJ82252.1 ABC transporter related protein [Bacillus methanolicus PB1]
MKRKQKGMALELERVEKSFGENMVLKEINLSIKSGEFIAIVGRSGCGKSTLLRLIAGLEPASKGRVITDGEVVESIHADARFMFQDSRLLPWKKVLTNVQIGTRSRSKIEAQVALTLVGLENRGNEWPIVLSGGQRQRIALARALAGEPRLLLLDEPLGALDALTRIEMQQLIERLWLQQGFTAILVTHDVSEAVALADRVILIEDGEVTMDIAITLNRPRRKDSHFSYLEKMILDRVMGLQESNLIEFSKPKISRSI